MAALDAFLQRKERGLNLSDRVWRYTDAFKREIERDTQRILSRQEPEKGSVNAVTAPPEKFKDWVKANGDRIEKSEKRGTLPYFIRDNRAAVDAVLKPETANTKAKTEESKAKAEDEERRARNRALYDKLKDNPEYTDVAFHEESGGMKATQIGHNFDGKKGWY